MDAYGAQYAQPLALAEWELVTCSEGHFLKVMFGRTHALQQRKPLHSAPKFSDVCYEFCAVSVRVSIGHRVAL